MRVRNMALCAFFAALLTLCAWLSIPAGTVAFTLQTFGVALTLLLLGGNRGTVAIFVYLLLGIVGLPVFTGFQGGIGVLLNVTGGYILGFFVWGLLYWLLTSVLPNTGKFQIIAMVLGLATCYCFGTGWFNHLYIRQGGSGSLGVVILQCVAPYLIPDAAKLALAFFLSSRLKRFVY